MSPVTSSQQSEGTSGLKATYEQLRSETTLVMPVAMCLPAMAILGSPRRFPNSLDSMLLTFACLLLASAVWVLRSRSLIVAGCILVVGHLIAIALLVQLADVHAAIYLVAVPVGLAYLAVSRTGGIVTAVVATLLAVMAPGSLVPNHFSARGIVLAEIWATSATMMLALRPLLVSVQWAWSDYERMDTLLRESREYQVRLHETLDDLADANVQLALLNRQAHSLRQVAEEERRAKERFVANVSHELRTPLNMIIGFCDLMTEAPETYGADVPPALLADLSVVLRNSRHLSALINDVLDLSQIEAGQVALSRERVGLSEIVDSAVVAVRPLFRSKGLSLETHIPQDLSSIFCDRTRIYEVILNLLSNAGRFTEQGGVEVRAWQEDSAVVCSVVDTGPGISEQDRDRLFKPFQQLTGAVRQQFGGTGLGLSISKNFVELHSGTMWVESEPGQGATFTMRLPIDPPAPTDGGVLSRLIPGWEFRQRTRRSRAPVPDARQRLIVAEEGDSMQRLLSRHLDGVEIVSTSCIEEACHEIERVPAQALVLNRMDVSGALGSFESLDILPNAVPAIICSVPGTEQAAGAAGVFDYLLKPISRERLFGALERLNGDARTVLIVDDEPEVLQLFGRMLTESSKGFTVIKASSGRQALQILKYQRPDAILLDLVMPEMDGFEFLKYKAGDKGLQAIPVILISARDPFGQPIVSNSLAVTRRGGLNSHELLLSIEALTAILSTAPLVEDAYPAQPGTRRA